MLDFSHIFSVRLSELVEYILWYLKQRLSNISMPISAHLPLIFRVGQC